MALEKGELMKILYIDVNCKSGSTGKIVYDLYKELRSEGQEAAICYGRGSIVDEPDIFRFSGKFEVYFHALMTRITGLTGCFSPFATRRLLKFIQSYQPDVVHIHELHGYFVNIKPVMNYLKKNKIRTVWTFHCEFMYTGRCGYAYECEKWKSGCGECPNIKEYPSSLFFDRSPKMFKDKVKLFDGFDCLTITAPSEWLAKRIRESFLSDKDIRVVHNGIDTTEVFNAERNDFLKQKHNIINEKIVIAVAPGLMQERKGGKWVVELAEKMKDDKIKFIMIGVDETETKFGDNIIALGRTENQKELAQYYELADLCLLTSFRETFSLVCVESLASGTPIAGFKAGAPETIVPPKLGKFVDYGDIESLRICVTKMLKEEKPLLECRDYAVKHFDKYIMFKSYKEIYMQ